MSGAGYCYYSLQFGRDLEKPQLNSLNNKGGSYAYLDFCIDPVPRSRRGAIRRSSAGFAAPATFGTTGKSNQRASLIGHVSGQPCIEQSTWHRNRHCPRLPFIARLSRLGPSPKCSFRSSPLYVAGLSDRRYTSLDRLRSVLRLAGRQPNGGDVLALRTVRRAGPVAQRMLVLCHRPDLADRPSLRAGDSLTQSACSLPSL